MVARVCAHGTWQWLMPVAQPREEKLAGERAYVVPRRVCGQGVVPEADAAGGIDLAEATADGPKITEILGFEGSALRQSFGDAAEELRLLDDVLRFQLTLPQPGKLILGVGCQEGHEAQRPGVQVRVAEMVHPCRIARAPATMFDGMEGGNGRRGAGVEAQWRLPLSNSAGRRCLPKSREQSHTKPCGARDLSTAHTREVSTRTATPALLNALDGGMNATAPSATSPVRTDGGKDRSRLCAGLSAALFVPAVLAAVMLLLSSVQVSGCVTYGVECTRGLPGWLFGWSVGLGALAFVVALAAPVRRVRQAALGGQLLAECTALLVILSYYP